jgi:hypothetical protein
MPLFEMLYDHVWSEAWGIHPSSEALNIFLSRIEKKEAPNDHFSPSN